MNQNGDAVFTRTTAARPDAAMRPSLAGFSDNFVDGCVLVFFFLNALPLPQPNSVLSFWLGTGIFGFDQL
jgi:hypothetical protein